MDKTFRQKYTGSLLLFTTVACLSWSCKKVSKADIDVSETPLATQSAAQEPLSSVDNDYIIRTDIVKQTLWGLGYEIQNDAIGSDNNGLPTDVIAVPNNLVASERQRFYTDMLKGFRYCRLAMGLYLRGTDAAQKQIKERYTNQMSDLRDMMTTAGVEGLSVEYWSPSPYWKSTNSYIGGSLKQYDDAFLDSFGNSLVEDINYLQNNGFKISMWGLQNEAMNPQTPAYSHCHYTADQYVKVFSKVAPKIKAKVPKAVIMADTWDGNLGAVNKALASNATALSYVDAWVMHRIGANSDFAINNATALNTNTYSKPVYSNEYEYFPTDLTSYTLPQQCINTAQTIMNWFTFSNSPTWFWLHALKPSTNIESKGYGLGIWRPVTDNNFSHYPNIKKGYWDYLPENYNAIAGFLKYLPWDAKRLQVDERNIRKDNRILVYKHPISGKLTIVVSNRLPSSFTFTISAGKKGTFKGHQYSYSQKDVDITAVTGPNLTIAAPKESIQFWVED